MPRQAREAAAAGMVQGSVTVAPQRDSSLIAIAIEGANPELAARLANAYADNFIQSNMERRYEATSYARNFLQQRIAAVKGRLEQSERAARRLCQGAGDHHPQRRHRRHRQRPAGAVDRRRHPDPDQQRAGPGEERPDRRRAALPPGRRRPVARRRDQRSDGPGASASSAPRSRRNISRSSRSSNRNSRRWSSFAARSTRLDKEIARQRSNVSGSTSGSLQADYQAALARENALQAKVNEGKAGLMALRERSIQYTILQREVDTNRSLYDALLQRFKEVGVAGGVGANVVSVVDRAQVPGAPFKPNLPLNIMIGLAIGLLLGLGTAFSIEWIDDTIKTPDDVGTKLGLASLGVIPGVGKGLAVREQLEDPRSQVSEAYQSVRTALQFSTDHGVPRSLLVTSTRASEGKSSTALALAQTLASLGASVLLIDADLRKPTFRGPSSTSQGLSSLLAGSDKVAECVHPTQMERLFLLPSGPIPPNPAELLASGRFKEILDEALTKLRPHHHRQPARARPRRRADAGVEHRGHLDGDRGRRHPPRRGAQRGQPPAGVRRPADGRHPDQVQRPQGRLRLRLWLRLWRRRLCLSRGRLAEEADRAPEELIVAAGAQGEGRSSGRRIAAWAVTAASPLIAWLIVKAAAAGFSTATAVALAPLPPENPAPDAQGPRQRRPAADDPR